MRRPPRPRCRPRRRRRRCRRGGARGRRTAPWPNPLHSCGCRAAAGDGSRWRRHGRPCRRRGRRSSQAWAWCLWPEVSWVGTWGDRSGHYRGMRARSSSCKRERRGWLAARTRSCGEAIWEPDLVWEGVLGTVQSWRPGCRPPTVLPSSPHVVGGFGMCCALLSCHASAPPRVCTREGAWLLTTSRVHVDQHRGGTGIQPRGVAMIC